MALEPGNGAHIGIEVREFNSELEYTSSIETLFDKIHTMPDVFLLKGRKYKYAYGAILLQHFTIISLLINILTIRASIYALAIG